MHSRLTYRTTIQVAAATLKEKVSNQITFKGHGDNIIYRNCNGHWTFVLPEMTINSKDAIITAYKVKVVAFDNGDGGNRKKAGRKKK